MEPLYQSFKHFRARAAASAGAFAASATLLLAVLGAFYILSSGPVLVDSPEARSAVAGCDARVDRAARRHCVQRLIASAGAHDAGASQVAELEPRRHGGRQ
jgi:hypothetical protein